MHLIKFFLLLPLPFFLLAVANFARTLLNYVFPLKLAQDGSPVAVEFGASIYIQKSRYSLAFHFPGCLRLTLTRQHIAFVYFLLEPLYSWRVYRTELQNITAIEVVKAPWGSMVKKGLKLSFVDGTVIRLLTPNLKQWLDAFRLLSLPIKDS